MLGQARKQLKNQKGVTLVELLAVIIILGIIALIAVPAIAGVIDNSRADSIKASGINYLNAAELYYVTEDVSDGSTVTFTELQDGNYINDREGVTWSGSQQITFTDGEPSLTADGEINGISVSFSGATISGINNSTSSELSISE